MLEPQTYQHHLSGSIAAISCVGGFGNKEEMLKVGRFPKAAERERWCDCMRNLIEVFIEVFTQGMNDLR